MKKLFVSGLLTLMTFGLIGQAGHIMQGIGAVNMSMGGAATGQPLDINGALHWNPAGISAFNGNILSANAGLFFSAPELSSTVPTQQGPFSGVTQDDRGTSIMPALAAVFAKEESKQNQIIWYYRSVLPMHTRSQKTLVLAYNLHLTMVPWNWLLTHWHHQARHWGIL